MSLSNLNPKLKNTAKFRVSNDLDIDLFRRISFRKSGSVVRSSPLIDRSGWHVSIESPVAVSERWESSREEFIGELTLDMDSVEEVKYIYKYVENFFIQ